MQWDEACLSSDSDSDDDEEGQEVPEEPPASSSENPRNQPEAQQGSNAHGSKAVMFPNILKYRQMARKHVVDLGLEDFLEWALKTRARIERGRGADGSLEADEKDDSELRKNLTRLLSKIESAFRGLSRLDLSARPKGKGKKSAPLRAVTPLLQEEPAPPPAPPPVPPPPSLKDLTQLTEEPEPISPAQKPRPRQRVRVKKMKVVDGAAQVQAEAPLVPPEKGALSASPARCASRCTSRSDKSHSRDSSPSARGLAGRGQKARRQREKSRSRDRGRRAESRRR